VGFEIKNFGNFSFKNRKVSHMRGWDYFKETIKDSIGEWGIHIQATGLLKVYCPEKYDQDPDKAFGELERIASNLAEKYAEVYGMKLGLLKRIREGEKELVNSELLGKLFGTAKIGDVWANASTGTMWLEEKQSSNSIEKLISLPELVTELLNNSVKQAETLKSLDGKLAPAINDLTAQIRLHLAVMEDMRVTMKEIREGIKKLGNRGG